MIIARYIDSSEVEEFINAGWSVKFCRFYQFDKMCYLATREVDDRIPATQENPA